MHHNDTLDIFGPIPSAVTSANVPHGLAVRASSLALFFSTLLLPVRVCTAAMFERLVTYECLWQVGHAAMHEAVCHGGVWLM